jgi:hypothetical protein
MLEADKILVQDFDIISELTSFVASGGTFCAEPGCHDDLTMCLVLFSWLSAQSLFKEMTDTDARKRLFEEKIQNLEEQILPFGFINDGDNGTGFLDDDGTLWHTVNDDSYDEF